MIAFASSSGSNSPRLQRHTKAVAVAMRLMYLDADSSALLLTDSTFIPASVWDGRRSLRLGITNVEGDTCRATSVSTTSYRRTVHHHGIMGAIMYTKRLCRATVVADRGRRGGGSNLQGESLPVSIR